ncbi:putative amidohydrolase [Rhodococcus sp. PvR044]|uniref:carbon-nitrogen hydrolase family protein n=1 Tax=unclassified Rhodococcus (in: high G+C Gram-positive bacteria) TaxID=192944 RepID=UPI000BC899CB|nr:MULTISPECIES: carbon-nitrogen hydrolase family protein [unclassified Rhodococcus (in: high G+C Gram-positive bacteria)]PTR45393.1 hypothetical protein C8K38_101120 [Rhodococcus sp. OK611]SNX88943.1 hypothetical protein SAMN05447004_101120 [Rhodococcus sp. OK270]
MTARKIRVAVAQPTTVLGDLSGNVAAHAAAVKRAAGGIRVLAVSGDGVALAYLKMSLGQEEARHFDAGHAPACIEVRGRRVGIGVCKDTRIEHHLDRTAALGIDLYVAGLVHAPDELAELDTRAQRIATAYDLPVAFAGFAGPTGGGYAQTCGGSGVWDSTGTVVVQLGPEPGTVASVEL